MKILEQVGLVDNIDSTLDLAIIDQNNNNISNNTIIENSLINSSSISSNEVNIGNTNIEDNNISNVATDYSNLNSITVNSSNDTNLSEIDDYFEKTKLERDTMYSKILESYQSILNNKDIDDTQKGIAINEIAKINNNQKAIMISENLIKNKGYQDVVILVNSNMINVVVKSVFLSDEDIGKIQNIIQREFNTDLKNVSISIKE